LEVFKLLREQSDRTGDFVGSSTQEREFPNRSIGLSNSVDFKMTIYLPRKAPARNGLPSTILRRLLLRNKTNSSVVEATNSLEY
jgi:hypothetical protein